MVLSAHVAHGCGDRLSVVKAQARDDIELLSRIVDTSLSIADLNLRSRNWRYIDAASSSSSSQTSLQDDLSLNMDSSSLIKTFAVPCRQAVSK